MTKEEKVRWDRLRARVEECDREIKELTASKIARTSAFDASSRMKSRMKSDCVILSSGQSASRETAIGDSFIIAGDCA
jgi:hypothetical protein